MHDMSVPHVHWSRIRANILSTDTCNGRLHFIFLSGFTLTEHIKMNGSTSSNLHNRYIFVLGILFFGIFALTFYLPNIRESVEFFLPIPSAGKITETTFRANNFEPLQDDNSSDEDDHILKMIDEIIASDVTGKDRAHYEDLNNITCSGASTFHGVEDILCMVCLLWFNRKLCRNTKCNL